MWKRRRSLSRWGCAAKIGAVQPPHSSISQLKGLHVNEQFLHATAKFSVQDFFLFAGTIASIQTRHFFRALRKVDDILPYHHLMKSIKGLLHESVTCFTRNWPVRISSYFDKIRYQNFIQIKEDCLLVTCDDVVSSLILSKARECGFYIHGQSYKYTQLHLRGSHTQKPTHSVLGI